MIANKKDEAYSQLQALEKFLLAGGMPKGPSMELEVRRIVSEAKSAKDRKHLKAPEAAFLNTFVIPEIAQYLRKICGLDEAQARDALLNEYHRSMPETAKYSPIHPGRHPFRKLLGASPTQVYRQWLTPDTGDGLTQSCPDFALRAPFPHTIVFEGKYYGSGSLEYGQRQLSIGLYQTFFYRGLAAVPAKYKGRPDWDYDYACFLAFDASKEGTLARAWKDLSLKVKRSFWDTANIYVMILRD